MKNGIKDLIGPDGGQTLPLEQGGVPLLTRVAKADPFKPAVCRWTENDCIVDTKDDCMASGMTYTIKCQECLDDVNVHDNGGLYRGQSGRSLHAIIYHILYSYYN